jgi:hypothetical protein
LTGTIIAAPLALRASDTYTPPSKDQQADLDAAKFELGQKIFTGKFKLPDTDAKLAETQAPKLKKLQEMLPKESQDKAKLPSLAGRLSNKQLAALEHFVQKRYCSK